jgi:hypothetical protein
MFGAFPVFPSFDYTLSSSWIALIVRVTYVVVLGLCLDSEVLNELGEFGHLSVQYWSTLVVCDDRERGREKDRLMMLCGLKVNDALGHRKLQSSVGLLFVSRRVEVETSQPCLMPGEGFAPEPRMAITNQRLYIQPHHSEPMIITLASDKDQMVLELLAVSKTRMRILPNNVDEYRRQFSNCTTVEFKPWEARGHDRSRAVTHGLTRSGLRTPFDVL